MARSASGQAWRRRVARTLIYGKALRLPPVSVAFDCRTYRRFSRAPSKHGRFGASMLSMPFGERMAPVVTFPYAPDTEWGPSSDHRIRKLNAPAYGLNDAPVARRQFPKEFFLNSAESLAGEGLRRHVSTFGPSLFFVFCEVGGSGGASSAHIGDSLGCVEWDVLAEIREFREYRVGTTKCTSARNYPRGATSRST